MTGPCAYCRVSSRNFILGGGKLTDHVPVDFMFNNNYNFWQYLGVSLGGGGGGGS